MMQPDDAVANAPKCEDFGVAMRWRGQTATFGSDSNDVLDEIHVYRCRKLVAHGGLRLIPNPADPLVLIPDGPISSDWAVFQVDRPVRQYTGSGERIPLPLATDAPAVGEDIVLPGHPNGQPVKIDADPEILEVLPNQVLAISGDSLPGSSGSPMINNDTGRVEGVLTNPPERLDGFFIEDVPEDCIEEFDCTDATCAGVSGPVISQLLNDPAVRARLSTRQLPDADGDGVPESITIHSANQYLTIETTFSGALGSFEEHFPEIPVDSTTDALPLLMAILDERLVVLAGTTAISFLVDETGLTEELRFPLLSEEYEYITVPDVNTLIALNVDGGRELYSLGDGSFLGTGVGSAEEYVMILLDETGSMTLEGTVEGVPRWDDAINAASAWVQVDSFSGAVVDRAYSVWTFKQDGTQQGAVQVWPTQTSASCANFEEETGYCLLGSDADAYDDLLTELESIREDRRAVAGPNTPLARSMCEALDTLRSVDGFKRIVLESDGGENITALTHACGGIDSAPFGLWNTSLSDWGMTVDSWQAKVVRRATRLDEQIGDAVVGELTANDFFPVDLAWQVDIHYAIIDPAPQAAFASLALFDLSPNVETALGSPGTGLVTLLAAPSGATTATAPPASETIDQAEYDFFFGLGTSNESSTFSEYASEGGAIYGQDHLVPGDVDDSGCTDQADLSIVLQHDVWMQRAVEPNQLAIRADVTRDGWVNQLDRDLILAHWGEGCQYAPPPPPEPSHCSDGIWSGDESDIDCGGTCDTCTFGNSCRANDDCQSGVCEDHLCRALEVDICECDPSKCPDCTNQISACEGTPGCVELVSCTLESDSCQFPHESCQEGQSCHQIVGIDQASVAGQAANNVISCLGGC